MEHNLKKIIKLILEQEYKNDIINEDVYEDFFYFIENDPRLNTFAYIYYLSSLDRYLSKPKSNPMFGKFYKLSRYKFRFGDTYKNAVERKNPEYQFKKRSGEYVKIEGYNVLERDSKGDEVLPIIPLETKSKVIVFDENNQKKETILVSELKEKYSDYFINSFLTGKSESSSGVDFRALKIKNTIKINAGGHSWINPYIKLNDVDLKSEIV
jgi:hypothetical protein